MSNSYQNNLDDASDVVIIGESPGFNKQQQPQASYLPSTQQYPNQNYQGNINSFQGNNNSLQGKHTSSQGNNNNLQSSNISSPVNNTSFQNNNTSFQNNNNSFQNNNNSLRNSGPNFQGQNCNSQNFQAVNNVTPQKNRVYANVNLSPSIQGQGYNQFSSTPRQQIYRGASPRFQSPGRGGHQQFNLSQRQQNPRPLLTAQQLQEILNSPKGKRLTPQQRNYLIQQQALKEKQLQQASTPPRPVAPPRQAPPVAVRYQINNSPSYKAQLDRRPSQETSLTPPITDPFKNLPREPVTIDLIEPDLDPGTQNVTPPLSMESSENASRNLMSTLDELNREKQEELNAVFAETNTNIETDIAYKTGKPDDAKAPSPENETTSEPKSPNVTSIPVQLLSVVPKIMKEILNAKQETPYFDGEDVLPKLDDTPKEPLASVPDIVMDNTEKNKDAGFLSDASSGSANPDTVKKRGRPKKTMSPFVDESDPTIRALIENGLDDPYSPEVDADDDEDYCPKPKKRRSKVHSKPLVRPQSNAETGNTISDSGIGTSVSSNDLIDDDQGFDLEVPASDRRLRVKSNAVIPTPIASESQNQNMNNKSLSETSTVNSDGESLTKVKPLILRLHHQKLSEDRRFKTFKNLSASVRKAKMHAKRSKKKSLSPEKIPSVNCQNAIVNEVPVIEGENSHLSNTEDTAKKPLGKTKGRKNIQTKPVTIKRGRGRPKQNKSDTKLQNLKLRTIPSRVKKDSTTVNQSTGLFWPPKQSKSKSSKTETHKEPNSDEASLPSKHSSGSSTPQARSEILLPPPVLHSELDFLPPILAPNEDPPDTSLPYLDHRPPTSTSKLDDQPISPPVVYSRSRRASECSSTRSSKKHSKKKNSGNAVAKEIEAVVSGLFGENFMNVAESSGYTVNITFDVEKKPPLPSYSNGTQAKNEKSEDTTTKNLRDKKQHLEKCDPNFFTNGELCSILQKRISNHPGIGLDLKAAYTDSIQHVQRLLDGNSK